MGALLFHIQLRASETTVYTDAYIYMSIYIYIPVYLSLLCVIYTVMFLPCYVYVCV